MTPYEQLVIASLRMASLEKHGAHAPCDIGVAFLNSVIVAKGEQVDALSWERLDSFWCIFMNMQD